MAGKGVYTIMAVYVAVIILMTALIKNIVCVILLGSINIQEEQRLINSLFLITVLYVNVLASCKFCITDAKNNV